MRYIKSDEQYIINFIMGREYSVYDLFFIDDLSDNGPLQSNHSYSC